MTIKTQFHIYHYIRRVIFCLAIPVVFTFPASNNLLAEDVKATQSPSITLDAAVNDVRSRYADAKILNTSVENTGNGKVYVIKMITADSRLIHIRVDAQSGQIIE